MSREQDEFSFIAPLPLEMCLDQLISLQRNEKIFSDIYLKVIIEQLESDSYQVELLKSIAHGISVKANLILEPQTAQTTLVSGSVTSTAGYDPKGGLTVALMLDVLIFIHVVLNDVSIFLCCIPLWISVFMALSLKGINNDKWRLQNSIYHVLTHTTQPLKRHK